MQYFVGYFFLSIIALGGFSFAQAVFWKLNHRFFWRGLIPFEVRRKIFPKDSFHMDPWLALGEWVALLFWGAFMTLPLITFDYLGLIRVLH